MIVAYHALSTQSSSAHQAHAKRTLNGKIGVSVPVDAKSPENACLPLLQRRNQRCQANDVDLKTLAASVSISLKSHH